MVHLRLVPSPELARRVLDALLSRSSVINVIHLPGAARKPSAPWSSGPEFGPLAGVCVALVRRELPLALRSLVVVAGVSTLALQRYLYRRRRAAAAP